MRLSVDATLMWETNRHSRKRLDSVYSPRALELSNVPRMHWTAGGTLEDLLHAFSVHPLPSMLNRITRL